MVEPERLAENVEFKMVDDRWVGKEQHGRVLEQEPKKRFRETKGGPIR